MSSSDSSSWATAERIAFLVTVTAGVIVLITWLWGSTDISGAAFARSASNFFTAVTAVGGMSMGALYLRRRLEKRPA